MSDTPNNNLKKTKNTSNPVTMNDEYDISIDRDKARNSSLPMKKTESQGSLTHHPKRPIANALYLQNINPLKARMRDEINKDSMTDLIAGGGEKVSIDVKDKSLTINSNTVSVEGGQNSRAKMAEKIAAKLPKAETLISLERQLSAERRKIHAVKHAPKTDEELLDKLISKHTEANTSLRRA